MVLINVLFQDQGSKMHRGIGFITFENAGQTVSHILLCFALCIMATNFFPFEFNSPDGTLSF